jgi:hypothetical protein
MIAIYWAKFGPENGWCMNSVESRYPLSSLVRHCSMSAASASANAEKSMCCAFGRCFRYDPIPSSGTSGQINPAAHRVGSSVHMLLRVDAVENNHKDDLDMVLWLTL